jgi:hypothetical protein
MTIDRVAIADVGAYAKLVVEELARTGDGLVGDGLLLEISTDLQAGPGGIEIASILSHRTKRGRVNLQIDGVHAQFDVAKAKEIHRMLGEAIEAAISDEVLFRFLRERIKLSEEAATMAMQDFRTIRQGGPGAVTPH